MRQFEEQTKKVKEVTSIVCNKCGRVIPVIEAVTAAAKKNHQLGKKKEK